MTTLLTVPELGDTQWPLDHEKLLWKCRQELLDAEYAAYQHGNRNTRQRGCDGPMCRKAARDYGRELQRRIHGAQRERVSAVRAHDEFLDAFIAYAHEHHRQSGLVAPKRRHLKKVAAPSKDNLVPLDVVRMLHRRRARLAS
jgi:hypothetical protein